MQKLYTFPFIKELKAGCNNLDRTDPSKEGFSVYWLGMGEIISFFIPVFKSYSFNDLMLLL